jgi:hypothetical protein
MIHIGQHESGFFRSKKNTFSLPKMLFITDHNLERAITQFRRPWVFVLWFIIQEMMPYFWLLAVPEMRAWLRSDPPIKTISWQFSIYQGTSTLPLWFTFWNLNKCFSDLNLCNLSKQINYKFGNLMYLFNSSKRISTIVRVIK